MPRQHWQRKAPARSSPSRTAPARDRDLAAAETPAPRAHAEKAEKEVIAAARGRSPTAVGRPTAVLTASQRGVLCAKSPPPHAVPRAGWCGSDGGGTGSAMIAPHRQRARAATHRRGNPLAAAVAADRPPARRGVTPHAQGRCPIYIAQPCDAARRRWSAKAAWCIF